jgi:surfactin synthase thioesterase subunit
VGGTIAILHPDDIGDAAALQRAIDRIAPTHFWLPTGLMEAMCAAGLRLPASVRSVSTGGDRLQGYCLPKGCGVPLANIYGPSEAAVITVACVLDETETQNVPIGRPVPNVCAYILDDAQRLLPRGAVGELCISGPFVGPGYTNDPVLTATKFVANPFARPGHEVLYRCGDLARWLPDGRMECLGRTDFQVKIRGYRIEPQEIAATLQEQPGLLQAFVDVIAHADKRLVAYCVADEGQDGALLEPALRAALARTMPSYMMPDRFVWLAALPLTDRGKVDRRALAALAPPPPRQVNTSSPRDDIELSLYNIWSGVLLHPEIGLRDNFFDIGGNSLSAIKIVHQINQTFDAGLAVTEIIANPTIESLGALIRAGKTRNAGQNPICFRRGAERLNVICIHPGGGTAFAYLSLAKTLPQDFGVWGVQAVGLQPGEEFLPDIGAMADHYINLVQDLLDRPFVLTGASFGGFVAYEMVRRLKLAGNDLGTAVMLDSMGSDDPALLEDAGAVSAAVFREKLVTYNGMYPGIDDAQIAQYHQIYNHHTLASRRWNFRTTDGRVLLVQAIRGRNKAQLRFLRFFWRMRAKGPFLFKLTAGDHSTTLEGADVARVGQIIANLLQDRIVQRGAEI